MHVCLFLPNLHVDSSRPTMGSRTRVYFGLFSPSPVSGQATVSVMVEATGPPYIVAVATTATLNCWGRQGPWRPHRRWARPQLDLASLVLAAAAVDEWEKWRAHCHWICRRRTCRDEHRPGSDMRRHVPCSGRLGHGSRRKGSALAHFCFYLILYFPVHLCHDS